MENNVVSKLKNFKISFIKYYSLCGLYFLKFFKKYLLQIIILIATIIALVARYAVIKYPTNDMVGYILNNWLRQISDQGFSSFYKIDSDYSPLYLLMLAIISLLPKGNLVNVNGYEYYLNQMIYLKSIYFVFTILLAFGIYLITKELTKNKILSVISYIVVISLPTIFINSAVWGNCDVIYATYLVYSFYFILKQKENLAFIFFGLALSNKLQGIFIFPFIVYLMLNRKLKFHKILYAALAFFLTIVPCYFFGASFTQPFKYIGKELQGYRKLTLGCPNMWQLLLFQGSYIDENVTWFGLLLIGIVFAIIYLRNINLEENETKFKVGILLIMTTIFFLPYMHERYFYLIDVLVVVYALIDKKKIHFIMLMQISSGIAYYHYLSGHYFIDPWGENSVSIAAAINLYILVTIFIDALKLPKNEKDILDTSSLDEEIKQIKE